MKIKKFLNEEEKVLKLLSAAVLVTNGKKLLIVRPTGKNRWELPKGEMEGESAEKTAIRELAEEAGVKINPSDLERFERFPLYRTKQKIKDVIIFIYRTNDLPPISSMKCTSFFKDASGRKLPEISAWKYIGINEIKKFVRLEMQDMILKAFK